MFAKRASNAFRVRAMGIIVLGFLIMYFSCCLASDALNVISPAFNAKFGWSYTMITFPATVAGYIVIGGAFIYSTIILKRGTRMIGTIAFAILAIATFLIGIAYSLDSSIAIVIFSIGLFLTRMFVTAIQIVCFQLCANWFHSTRGRVLGIMTMAAPLNSATTTSIMTKGMQQFGFTAVYMIVALILVFITIFTYIYGISTPEELGLTPDGIAADETGKSNSKIQTGNFQTQWTLNKLLKIKESWLLAIGFGFFNMIIPAVMAFFIVRMGEIGVTTNTALLILTVASLVGIPLSYLFGWIDDKMGTPKASMVLGLTNILMLLSFYFGTSNNMILLCIAAFGMASIVGGTPNLHPSTIIYVFGAKEYQSANRYISIVISLISAGGITFMSLIKDSTGSLDLGYLLMAVMALIGTICMILIKKQYSIETCKK